jgi:hypothetical protein
MRYRTRITSDRPVRLTDVRSNRLGVDLGHAVSFARPAEPCLRAISADRLGVRSVMMRGMVEFGCHFCRDDQNRLYGHVTQIASNDHRGTILIRCPRCGALYENTAGGPDETRRLSVEDARERFPDAPIADTP